MAIQRSRPCGNHKMQCDPAAYRLQAPVGAVSHKTTLTSLLFDWISRWSCSFRLQRQRIFAWAVQDILSSRPSPWWCYNVLLRPGRLRGGKWDWGRDIVYYLWPPLLQLQHKIKNIGCMSVGQDSAPYLAAPLDLQVSAARLSTSLLSVGGHAD